MLRRFDYEKGRYLLIDYNRSLLCLQFFDFGGSSKIVGEGLGVGAKCIGCAQESCQAVFRGGISEFCISSHMIIYYI